MSAARVPLMSTLSMSKTVVKSSLWQEAGGGGETRGERVSDRQRQPGWTRAGSGHQNRVGNPGPQSPQYEPHRLRRVVHLVSGKGILSGTKLEGGDGDALLVGLHVDGAADDDLQEEHSPLRGLLGAALYRVKHAPHLPGPQQVSQMAQGWSAAFKESLD